MQESSAPSEHGQQPQRVRARGIPAGVADPYLWQFLYRRHVLREIAAGQAGVAGDGTVPPLLPSKDSENLYWLAVAAPSSALGSSSSSHNRALCPSNSHGNNGNQRVGGVGNHEIVTFFDQPLLRGSTSCRRILPAPGPPPQPVQVQPVLSSRPSASIMASAMSTAARGNQNGPPGAARSHARQPERIRTPPMQEGPMPAEISSQRGGATRNIAPMPAKISSQRDGKAREIAPIPAEISPARGGAAQDCAAAATAAAATAAAAAVAAAETNAWQQVQVDELAATATPPPPPPPRPAVASSTATAVTSAATTVTSTATATAAAAGRPQRPMMPGFSYTREVLQPLEAALARSSIGSSPCDSSCAKGVPPSREASLLGGNCGSKVTSSSPTPRAGTHRSTDPGHQGATGTALREDPSNTVAVHRQRQHPEACLRTQSASPSDSGKVAQRRGAKTKRRRPLFSAREKNASATNASSNKPSRSRRSSGRPPQPSDSALASRRCHTTVCASCQTPPLEGEHVGLCLCCPRMFCPACLGAVNAAAAGRAFAAGDADADPVGLGGGAMVVLDNAALLEAELAGGGASAPGVHAVGADVSIWQCSLCDHGSDLELPPPPPPPPLTLPTSTPSKRPQPAHNRDILPKVHLLRELVKHDLSRCFRAPVNVYVNKGYLNAVNRDYMMDLGTMMSKVRFGKYRGDRGAAAFYVDLGRVWDNCRAYAECDRRGKPLVRGSEAVVPGIVRCAFALEKMAKKFVNEHIPDDKHPPQWYEQSWNPFPKPNSSPDPSQRNRL